MILQIAQLYRALRTILRSSPQRGRATSPTLHCPRVCCLALRAWSQTNFIAGCIAAILIAILGAVVFDRFQEPATVAFSTSAVRL
jgi:hypothetical protein